MREYFKHLLANWKVALHSLNDFAEHFIHGLFPFISWKHYERNIDRNIGEYYDYRVITGKDAIDLINKTMKPQSEKSKKENKEYIELLDKIRKNYKEK